MANQTAFFSEWDSDWQGPPVIVEVLETSSTDLSQNAIVVNGTNIQGITRTTKPEQVRQ